MVAGTRHVRALPPNKHEVDQFAYFNKDFFFQARVMIIKEEAIAL
jgi:hypothetical protein